MPTFSFAHQKPPALLVNLYSTKRRIFGEVHVFSDRFDHYMQRHVSQVLYPDKSKVSPDVDADYLIIETLNYGVPVSYTDGRLELRLHFSAAIGHVGCEHEAYYTVLILEVHKGQWKFGNLYVDKCGFTENSKARKCHWRHDHQSATSKLYPNVEQDFDILDRTVLYEIKHGCLNRYGSYNHKREGIIKICLFCFL